MGQEIKLPGNNKALPLATLGTLLQNSDLTPPGINYQVAYKGKWHLDANYASGLSSAQQKATAATLQKNNNNMESLYGFPGWTSPEFGTTMVTGYLTAGDSSLFTLGAGVGENDERVTKGASYPQPDVENAVSFLNNYTPNQDNTNPFFLVVSLLNPHDVWVYPYNLEVAGFEKNANGKYPWNEPPFLGLTTPQSFNLSVEQLSNKPTIQATWRSVWPASFNQDDADEYIRFYAYLHTLTDALLGDVVSALENNQNNLKENTLIIRLADHGEMAQAQGGMIEKACQTYNETLLVPMTFSAPGLPQGRECTGLTGLIDLVPTIASIIGIDLAALEAVHPIQGISIDQAILDPQSNTASQLLFATDDDGAHIRCLIETQEYNAKYAVYYSAEDVLGIGNPNGTASDFQYELYNYRYDPDSSPASWDSEETNLIPKSGSDPLSDGYITWVATGWGQYGRVRVRD
jgi:arylsulfatase A-like enzyme